MNRSLTSFFQCIVTLCILSGCQQLPDNELNKKQRLYIRNPNLSVDKIAVSSHELLAHKYPKHYIIEGHGNNKTIALTFDDGPSNYSQKLLDVLASHNVKATFFMVGIAIHRHQELAKDLHLSGHLIANHSWDHQNANNYDNSTLWWNEQIAPTNQLIKRITGKKPQFYRPPFGSISEQQAIMLKNNSIKTIIWSIDTQDWNDNTNTSVNVANLATVTAHPEAIILLHDGGGNRQGTVDAIPQIIKHYQDKGYRFVTIDELLGDNN